MPSQNPNNLDMYDPNLSWQQNLQNAAVNDTLLNLQERVREELELQERLREELELYISVAERRHPQNWLLFDDHEVYRDFFFYDVNGGFTTVLTIERSSELAQILLYLEPLFYLPQ